ncbi:hypothetical protein BOTBODRAFT_26568 [Botryobasidium botryosum FD-172 SS1]|uniref:SGT1-domain-containing protein n=1 Tax=Botryobasidium botryosum (strain FD-172 SS1) TaxID=930990 RepID=A0A067N0T3_BOTB1|nr:hypothetical protein BOTBODRAFT_26568 [Botryobasidium botryosum FD-172 SS1]
MDIFNRPPPISEDTLLYTIYPDASTSLSEASTASLSALIQSRVRELLPSSHLWHRDAFELNVVPSDITPQRDAPHSPADSSPNWMLEGRMRVGDCVDDEWCVVWLLREVSKLWDVCIQVYDSDGQFLLIEAADALPHWVTPSNADNRVWIYKYNLHLIPLPYVSSPSTVRTRKRHPGASESDDEGLDDDEDYLDIPDALRLVRDEGIDTLASPDVQAAAWARVQSYPSLAQQHTHLSKAYLPSDVSLALHQNPSLVQKAVEAFYTRDGIQLRAVHAMSRFPPSTIALSSVRMTRTAYAQLVGQKFHPPKVFGRWSEREGSREWKWRDIGMKIACGFEMLYAESKGRTKTSPNDSSSAALDARKEALRRDTGYAKYIQSLVSAGYFRGELEGSSKWSQLEDQAAQTWIDIRKKDDASRPSFAALVNTAIEQARSDGRAAEQPEPQIEEDSDEWLNVDPTSLEGMLRGTAPPQTREGSAPMDVDTKGEEEEVTEEQAKRLKDLAQKVERFVEGEGSLDGAIFEDELLSDEEFSDEPSGDDGEDGSDGEEQTPAAPPPSTKERDDAMAALVAPLPASEYGVMPTSFSKSQKTKPATLDSEVSQVSATSPPKPVRKPILMRDRFDGVDSDDETDSGGEGGIDDDDDDDRPMVVGDVEVDMEEEEEGFLKFSREALGISDDMWSDIIKERREKGAFVPLGSSSNTHPAKPKTDNGVPPQPTKTENPPADILRENVAGRSSRPPWTPAAGPRPNVNPNLDSFEAVMQAMEEELKRAQHKGKSSATNIPSSSRPAPPKPSASAGPSRDDDDDDEDVDEDEVDIEGAMAAELREALEHASDEDEEGDGEPSIDYNLIKNFLASFKSQGGLSGPVSNLAGRLEGQWGLPRDEN